MENFSQQIAKILMYHLGDADGSGKVIPIDSQSFFLKATMDMLNQKLADGFKSPEEETIFHRAALPLHISLSAFISRKRGDPYLHWISADTVTPPSRSSLRWTGTKAEAVEII